MVLIATQPAQRLDVADGRADPPPPAYHGPRIAGEGDAMRARSRWLATAVSAVLASSVLSVVPAAAQDDGFDFKPLLMPFPAGEGRILPGSTLHTGGDSEALDLCQGVGCDGGQVGDPVIAPTDLTYDDLSISTNDDDTDAPDFHFFEIASNADDRLCMSLGHFDLSEPGTLVDGKRTYQQGEPLGTLLDFPTVPHIHMGLYTVPVQSRCNSKQRYLDPTTGELRGRTAVAFEGEFAIEGLPVHGSVGSEVTSTNGSGDSDPIRIAQWIEPAEGATVGPRLTLAAWPTPVLVDDSLTDDLTTARVDFHVMVDGEKVEACSADRADDTGAWACEANLLDIGVEEGELQLTFDVIRTDGGVAPAPGGTRTVVYAVPLRATWKSPAKGAKLGDSILTLSAKLGGGSAASGIDRVVFHVQWDERKPRLACVATKGNKQGIWSCKVDLWKLGAQLGRLKLSFNAFYPSGQVSRSPAGTRAVRFESPPPRPANAAYAEVSNKVVKPGFAERNHIDRVSWTAPVGSATQYDIYRVRGACYAARRGDPCIREGLNLRSADLVHLGTVDGSKRSFLYRYGTGFEAFVEDATTAILVQARNRFGYSKSAIAWALPCGKGMRCPNR